MLTALSAAKQQYIREFLKSMNMPNEAWIYETAYDGLDEEFSAIENKYIHKIKPGQLKDLYGKQQL